MNQITLLTWPDYINPATLAGFENTFNIKVNLEIVPSAVELIERMKEDDPAVDVLVPPDYAVRELGSYGKLLHLDHGRLPNMKNLFPRFQKGRSHDPNSEISIIKDWGTTGFMYRSDIVNEEPGSWKDFWSLAKIYSGQVTVLDSPGEVIGAALKMRGESYNAVADSAMEHAREDLLEIRSHLHSFDTTYKPLRISGEVCLALGWNGDAAALIGQNVPIKYVIPEEGSQLWEDDWAIATGASNIEGAYLFLNYLLQPEVAAQEALYTRYATGNEGAFQLLSNEVKNDLSTYPPEEIIIKLEAGMPLSSEGQNKRDALWSMIRS